MLKDALNQAKEARLKILEVMTSAIPEPREDVGENAPKILSFEIPVEKIGEVIGPKGKMINTIQAETGAEITVDDDGMSGIVSIASPDREKVAEAERQVMLIVDPPSAHVGEVYEGRVVNITKFGAFVNILPGRDGLVHISKLGGGKRIDKVEDVLALGDAIEVEVEDIDPNGKISLRPLSDGDNDQSHEDKSSETIEEDESSDRDDDSSDADDFNQKDDDSDNRDSGSKAKTAASFEDAFQAELEAVHGDLGKSSSRRSGERKRR